MGAPSAGAASAGAGRAPAEEGAAGQAPGSRPAPAPRPTTSGTSSGWSTRLRRVGVQPAPVVSCSSGTPALWTAIRSVRRPLTQLSAAVSEDSDHFLRIFALSNSPL